MVPHLVVVTVGACLPHKLRSWSVSASSEYKIFDWLRLLVVVICADLFVRVTDDVDIKVGFVDDCVVV